MVNFVHMAATLSTRHAYCLLGHFAVAALESFSKPTIYDKRHQGIDEKLHSSQLLLGSHSKIAAC